MNTILVVNNGSTDGTKEWLESQKDLSVINQKNVGGSGGFYTGIKNAQNINCEWLWCMDDDVYPKKDCLERLLKWDNEQVGILCPQRIMNDELFVTEVTKLNLVNPLKKLHAKKIIPSMIQDKPIEIEGMVFEGPLIKKTVVNNIGYPEKDLFLFYDDTDYSYRATLAGYKVLYVPGAILDKEYFYNHMSQIDQVKKGKWKLKYHLRNTVFFCKKYGKNKVFQYFGASQLYLKMLIAISKNLFVNDKYNFSDFILLGKMFKQGWQGKLGKIE